jgi:hypothetical protein
MIALTLQSTQIGFAQPGHLWLIISISYIAIARGFVISRYEVAVFGVFFLYTCSVQVLTDFDRIKAAEQIFKFGFVYPGFYLVGRWFGRRYSVRTLPLGLFYLVALLGFEVLIQRLAPPGLYTELTFAEGALHGTFKERNWLADYFLLFSYFIFEKETSDHKLAAKQVLVFVAINALVMVVSGSKTTFVACGMVLLIRSRIGIPAKLALAAIGVAVYWSVFASDFSEQNIRVRLEEERGLALQQAVELISQNPLGYGLGFVESYFTNLGLAIRGLGSGTNSVFAVPLDLTIIAGPAGLLLWLVFFGGIGIGSVTILAPVAALSLLNPLHQSEIVYFLVGMLVSFARHRRPLESKPH